MTRSNDEMEDIEERTALYLEEKGKTTGAVEPSHSGCDRLEKQQALEPYADELPYDRNRVVNEIRFFMNQTAQGMIETGKRLILLKANEGHGRFVCIVEDELAMPHRTAVRFMALARKFANSPRVANLAVRDLKKGIGKLYALLEVPEEELQELEATGQIRGLTIDEIDALPVKEVRDRLRKCNRQIEQGRMQLNEANDKIRSLNTEVETLKNPPSLPPPSSLEQHYLDIVTDLGMRFETILYLINTKIPFETIGSNVPQAILKKLTYLLLYIQRETMNERLRLSQHYEPAAEDVPWEPMAMELPPDDEINENTPHMKPVLDMVKSRVEKAQNKEVSGSNQNET